MDVRDFRIMIQKHAPWLARWVAYRTGQFKITGQTDQGFETVLAKKVKSITERRWEDLRMNVAETSPSVTPIGEASHGFIVVLRYPVVVWQKKNDGVIRYTDNKSSMSPDHVLQTVWAECRHGDVPEVHAIVETIYTIDTASTNPPTHDFVIYPCTETLLQEWVDAHKEDINKVLASQGLILASYTVFKK